MGKKLMNLPGKRRRLGLLATCLLPAAFGVGVHTPHTGFLATHTFACTGPGSGVAPSVRTTYASAERQRPRPKSSTVSVYSHDQTPERAYEVLGEVGVLAHSSHTGIDELTRYAEGAARQMGGDAIIDMSWDDAASVRPKAGEQGMLYLSGSVVRWQ
jgi:hypothetical protein